MTVEHIAGPDDARVAQYRGLLDADLMRAHGLFVAEGRLIVRRVIEDGRFRVRSVLVNDAAARDLAPVFAALAPSVPVCVAEPAVLSAIAGYDVHRGCLALVERPPARTIAEVLAVARTLVILEGVANADNVGGVFRNAAAFGCGGVLLSPACCDPLYRKAIRTSMGAVLHVPHARADAWPGALTDVRAAGFTLVALTPREPSESIEAFAGRPRVPPPRVALIVGAEGAGLSAAVEAAADCRVRIPISPEVDSLNLSVAAGIALHALRK